MNSFHQALPLTFTVSIEPKNQTPVTVPITAHDETNSSLDFRTSQLIVGTDGTVTGQSWGTSFLDR